METGRYEACRVNRITPAVGGGWGTRNADDRNRIRVSTTTNQRPGGVDLRREGAAVSPLIPGYMVSGRGGKKGGGGEVNARPRCGRGCPFEPKPSHPIIATEDQANVCASDVHYVTPFIGYLARGTVYPTWLTVLLKVGF